MMRHFTHCLLLIAAFAPTVVAANPVFHCRTTGSEGFVMECCGEEDAAVAGDATPVPSCCREEVVVAPAADPLATGTTPIDGVEARLSSEARTCTCCEISFIQLISLDPRAGSVDTDVLTAQLLSNASVPWCVLPAAPLSLIPPSQLNRRRAPPPAADPPLPILHAALRL